MPVQDLALSFIYIAQVPVQDLALSFIYIYIYIYIYSTNALYICMVSTHYKQISVHIKNKQL